MTLPGRRPGPPRVVVSLLHANEPSGARAMHAWLQGSRLPAIDSVFFFASVQTALTPPVLSRRHRDGEPDANRCFLDRRPGPVGANAHDLLARLRRASPEALLDLHNNTGHNPPYGVGPGVTCPQLNLTRLFATRYMATDLRLGALMEATAARFPTATIECGKAFDAAADAVAAHGLGRFLDTDDLELEAPPPPELQVLGRPVRVSLHRDVALGFGQGPAAGAGLTLRADIDRHNFAPLAAGELIGWSSSDALPVEAVGASGEDLAPQLFECRGGRLVTRAAMVPVMMTVDPRVAVQDCLFYAMLEAADAPSALAQRLRAMQGEPQV
jgi:hypothetical protein